MNTDDIKISHVDNKLTIDFTEINEWALHLDIDILNERIIIRQDMKKVKQIVHSNFRHLDIKHNKSQTFADINIQGVTKSPCSITISKFDTRNLIIDVTNNNVVELQQTTVLSALYINHTSRLYLFMSYLKRLSVESNSLEVLQITESSLNGLNGDRLSVRLLTLGNPNLCDMVMDQIHVMGVSPETKLYTTDVRINEWFPETNVVMCVKQSNEAIGINTIGFPEQVASYLLLEIV